jgi:hypothetical protein
MSDAVSFVGMWLQFLAMTLAIGLPLFAGSVLAVVLLRRWISAPVLRAIVMCGFAAGAGYTIYRSDWYDVWRYGVPPVSYLAMAYLPYMAVFAALGWLVASVAGRVKMRKLA